MEQADDLSALRELAERLVDLQFSFGGPAGERPHLFVQALPPRLPFDLAIPDGGRLVGSVLRRRDPRPGAPAAGMAMDVVLDVPGEAEPILQFYEQSLTGQGWSVHQAATAPRMGGFAPIRFPPSRTFCKSANGPSASVRVLAGPDGTSDVRVHTDPGPGPCAMPQHPGPPFANLLPALTAPAGVQMEPLGGGGGSGGWSSTALATTAQSCAELEAHFAGQFQADGWVRQEGNQTGPLAVSTWTSPSHAGWRGVLLVAEESPNRRLLHARVEPASGGGFGRGTGWVGSVGPMNVSSRAWRAT